MIACGVNKFRYRALSKAPKINKRDLACEILEVKRALNLRLLDRGVNKFI